MMWSQVVITLKVFRINKNQKTHVRTKRRFTSKALT